MINLEDDQKEFDHAEHVKTDIKKTLDDIYEILRPEKVQTIYAR